MPIPKKIIVITGETELKLNENSGYEVQKISPGENLFQKAQSIVGSNKNAVVFVDSTFAQNFSRLMNFKRQMFKSNANTVFILGNQQKVFTIKAEHTFDETKYANVVGILHGKSKRNEYVIFSGHYDHLGIAKQPLNSDSIYKAPTMMLPEQLQLLFWQIILKK